MGCFEKKKGSHHKGAKGDKSKTEIAYVRRLTVNGRPTEKVDGTRIKPEMYKY